MDKAKSDGDTVTRIIQALELMLAPEGATLQALMERLNVTRRSVFRLFKTMERKLPISVVSCNETLGKDTVYRLSAPSVEILSYIKIDLTLSLQEALFVYTLLCGSGVPSSAITDKIINACDLPNWQP